MMRERGKRESQPKTDLRQAIGWGAAAVASAATGAIAVAAGGIALAKAAATPAKRQETPVEVARVAKADGRQLLWLRGPDVDLPGQYSLIWNDGAGHARLGDIAGRSGSLVARPVLFVDRGELTQGLKARISGWWYPSFESFARERDEVRDVTEIELTLPGGPARAWVIRPQKRGWRGRGQRWAVHVHGRGALPEETLRGVAPFAAAGVTSLVLSYRNDPGAPEGALGRYGFGVAEADDVDAAIAYALDHGATRVSLVGWSMGGTACLAAANSGAHRNVIDGLVLDSPAVDWAGLLYHQAKLNRAPRIVATLGMELLERGIVAAGVDGGFDTATASPEAFAKQLDVPVLIIASRGDTFVPDSGAARLAKLRPDMVQLECAERAEHVKIWNTNPAAWEERVGTFVRALPKPAWRG